MKQIKTSTALIIVFAAAIIIGGGVLAWAFGWGLPGIDVGIQSPVTVTKKTNTNANKNANTNSTKDETADWKTYKITDLNLSFKYPKEWEEVSLTNNTAETGTSKNIGFSNSTGREAVRMGYASNDFSCGRSGYFYEVSANNNDITKYKNCANLQETENATSSLKSCKDIQKNGKTIGILITYNFGTDEMLQGPYTVTYYITNITKYPIIGIEASTTSDQLKNQFEKIIQSIT